MHKLLADHLYFSSIQFLSSVYFVFQICGTDITTIMRTFNIVVYPAFSCLLFFVSIYLQCIRDCDYLFSSLQLYMNLCTLGFFGFCIKVHVCFVLYSIQDYMNTWILDLTLHSVLDSFERFFQSLFYQRLYICIYKYI